MSEVVILALFAMLLLPYAWVMTFIISQAYFFQKLEYHKKSIQTLIELEEANGKVE
jgi:hypothetical protein